jgi:hypothetical protein
MRIVFMRNRKDADNGIRILALQKVETRINVLGLSEWVGRLEQTHNVVQLAVFV